MAFEKGDFVIFDGVLAVIVGTETDQDVPEGHVALWYGHDKEQQTVTSKPEASRPETWTVPQEYCQSAKRPKIQH